MSSLQQDSGCWLPTGQVVKQTTWQRRKLMQLKAEGILLAGIHYKQSGRRSTLYWSVAALEQTCAAFTYLRTLLDSGHTLKQSLSLARASGVYPDDDLQLAARVSRSGNL